MENYLEYTLEKLVLEKAKHMKYSKLKVHFKNIQNNLEHTLEKRSWEDFHMQNIWN